MLTDSRRRVVAVCSAFCAVVLTACASKGSEMTPEQARDSPIKIAEDTAALLDIDGWKDEVSLAQGCSAGVEFGYTYAARPLIPSASPRHGRLRSTGGHSAWKLGSTPRMTRSSSEAAAPFRASASPRAQGCTTFPEPPFACPATPTITADASAYPCGHVAPRSTR